MKHKPVLLREMVDTLSPFVGATYIDATYGGGGYTKAIKDAADCKVIAFDRDPDVSAQGIADEFYNAPFSCIGDYITEQVDGAVFDLGVSNFQLSQPHRGFSFKLKGPLDMRMSQSGKTAESVINTYPEKQLADIIYRYGEEKQSRKIARAIVESRPFKDTISLAETIKSVMPSRQHKIHPATKTFQAIRIYVNDELNEIKNGIKEVKKLIKFNGKIIVITFHALEDRVVKEELRDGVFKEEKKIFPSKDEVALNPKSRSAKLRSFIKVV